MLPKEIFAHMSTNELVTLLAASQEHISNQWFKDTIADELKQRKPEDATLAQALANIVEEATPVSIGDDGSISYYTVHITEQRYQYLKYLLGR